MSGSAQLPAQLSAFPNIQTLVRQIQRASESNLTGSLNFDTVHLPRMRLYFVMGRLVWAGGGLHRLRRWRRLLNQCCPGTTSKLQALAATRDAPHSEYAVLRRLVQSNHISRDIACTMIHTNMVEVLFDIVQAFKLIEKFSCTKTHYEELQTPLTLIALDELVHDLEAQWREWCDAHLAPYSPNLAPALIKPESLRTQVAPQTFERLGQMLQGQLSLRELAVLIQWDLSRFSESMISYEQQGILQLRITPDLTLPSASKGGAKAAAPSAGRVSSAQPPSTKPSQVLSKNQSKNQSNRMQRDNSPSHSSASSSSADIEKPLVMCVDDSPGICRKMQEIMEGAGYRYISVQDPIQALPMMLEKKPDLLLIDLVMPVIGGYELCSQIRRIPAFQETPLIIFSSNVLDRIRAKLVGANDSLAKSVPSEQVIATVERWLSAQALI